MNLQQVASPADINSDTSAMLEAEYLNKLLDKERSARLDVEQRLELKTREFSNLEKRHEELMHVLSNRCKPTVGELPAAQEVAGPGTITCNLSNETTNFSDGVYSILGLELDQGPLDISRIIAMIHGDDRARVKKYLEYRGGQEYSELPISAEFRICLAGGQQRWVEVHSEFTVSDCGEKNFRVMAFQDASQRKAQDEKLRRSEALAVDKLAELEGLQSDLMDSRDKAEKASRTKSRFLAVMSHEIRTPLNGVLGSLQLLSDVDLKTPEQELVNVATSSAENLRTIANDVIELSRMEAGRLDLELIPLLNIAGRPAHVLLVEDVFTNQVIADAFLRGWGCHVDIAENGAEALSAIQECLYDVVLMDVTMPIMDGVEATLQIRASAMEQAQLPIVGLTAYAHEEEKKAFLAAGMNDVIHKPLNKNELHEALSVALASNQEKSDSRHTVKQPSSYLDRAILDELRDSLSVDKMNHLMGRIMIDIKNNHEEAIVGAKSGNAERVGRACHALKGMGGSFGSPELSRLAGEIQLAWRRGEIEKVMAMALSDLDHMCARLIVALESYKRSIVRI